MTFSEKDFPKDTTIFPFRTQILRYLKEYGKDVKDLVELNKEVVRIEKQGKWCLTIRDSRENSRVSVEQFDAVAVATGTTAIDCLIVNRTL